MKSSLIKKNPILVKKSNCNLYITILSTDKRKILVSCSTRDRVVCKIIKEKGIKNNSFFSANLIGKILAIKAIKRGIKNIYFDRSGYKFHGKIKEMFESFKKYFYV